MEQVERQPRRARRAVGAHRGQRRQPAQVRLGVRPAGQPQLRRQG